MPLSAVLVDAGHPALEHAEIAFGGIDAGKGAILLIPHVFLGAVVDGAMALEAPADPAIGAVLVGHQVALAVGVSADDRAQRASGDIFNLDRTGFAAALNERDDGDFASAVTSIAPPAAFIVELPRHRLGVIPLAEKGLVYLDRLTLATEWAEYIGIDFLHGLAEPMADEPAGFEIDAKGAAELVCRETFLARRHQMRGLKPNVHRYMAFLKDRADLHGERLAAGPALIDADPRALALELGAVVYDAALRADAPVGPHDRLDEGIGSFFIAEAAFVENGFRHRLSPCGDLYNADFGTSSPILSICYNVIYPILALLL